MRMDDQAGSWNLFARVLQEILSEHGYGLGYIDDRTYVHPEKVRRLQRSLKVPKSFPVLNVDEMEQVISAFKLNARERIRLRAALLATAIEEMLMDRINQNDALKAAEQILTLIEQVLCEHEDDPIGIGVVKSGGTSMADDTEIDRKLGGSLALIDHAMLLLHLSHSATSHSERIERARQAMVGFESSRVQLSKATPTLKESEPWQVWDEEAQKGLVAAQKQLASLLQYPESGA